MDDPSEGREYEEVETIPWAMLSQQLDGNGMRLRLPLVVGALFVAAVVFAVVTLMRSPDDTVVAPAATVVTGTVGTVAPPETASPDTQLEEQPTTVPAVPAPPEPALYSEADLMAVLPDEEARLVAAHAEAFVADYFTVDGAIVESAAGKTEPDPLHPLAAEGAYSWVEWVRTAHIEALGAGSYRITVAFRTLARTDGDIVVRQRVRAVTVPLIVDPGAVGGAPVVNGPLSPVDFAPVELVSEFGSIGGTETDTDTQVEPAPDVTTRAIEQANLFGDDVEVAGAVAVADGWEVIVVVGDGSGVRWPLMTHVTDPP